MNNCTLALKSIVKVSLVLAFLMAQHIGYAQTTLSAGDAAIIAYNSDGADEFAFILLADVTVNTELNFTDASWEGCDGSAAFRSTELTVGSTTFVLTWTADQDYVIGDVFIYDDVTSSFDRGNTTGAHFSASNSGDQIFIFQGATSSPSFIFGCQFATSTSNNGIVDCPTTDANDTNDTNIPSGLSEGTTFIDFGFGASGSDDDNGYFSGSTSGDLPSFLNRLATSGNWTSGNSEVETSTWEAQWNTTRFSLPIELASFEAQLEGSAVIVDWVTLSEINNDFMAVEHSTDGRIFNELGRVAGAGTTTETQKYSYLHTFPATGMNYYRLRQVDYDGTMSYSKVVAVRNQEGQIKDLTVFPNPVQDIINISIPEVSGEVAVAIYNLSGQIVYQAVEENPAALLTYPTNDLPQGTYLVQVNNSNEVHTRRFIKK